MNNRDKIFNKIILYLVAPVILVLVCVLIYLFVKNYLRSRQDDLVQGEKLERVSDKTLEIIELLDPQAQKNNGQSFQENSVQVELELVQTNQITTKPDQKSAKEQVELELVKDLNLINQEFALKQANLEQELDFKVFTQKSIFDRIQSKNTRLLNRNPTKRSTSYTSRGKVKIQPKDQQNFQESTSENSARFPSKRRSKSTNSIPAKVQLSSHQMECYIQQCAIRQIPGYKDRIGIMIAELKEKLRENINQHKLLFAFLEKMRTFNFFELIGENHEFNLSIARNYVSDYYVICNILCNYIEVYRNIKLSVIQVMFADELLRVKELLENIYERKYKSFSEIFYGLNKILGSNYSLFFNKLPCVLWSCSMLQKGRHLEEFAIIAINITKKGRVHTFFYSVGGMSTAVMQWQSHLREEFSSQYVCFSFDNLVALGKLHLNNSDIKKIADAEESLYYAEKFVEIDESIPRRKDLAENKRADLILSKLRTITGMNVPQIGVDVFPLPSTDKVVYYFANVQSLALAIKFARPCSNWRGKIGSSQLHYFINQNPQYYSFDIGKCREHIADLSKFTIEVQKTNPTLDDNQSLINATKAILTVNEILTAAFGNDTIKLTDMVSELKSLEYLQDEQAEIDDILCDIKSNDKIVKLMTAILKPLEAFGVELPVWEEKYTVRRF